MMSSNAWPLSWINKTFTSRERTEELLKPELESSRLSYSDYEKAVEFLPGKQRHYQTVGSYGAASVAVYYGLRKPQWSVVRSAVWGGLAGLSGGTLGLYITIRAHVRFFRSLDDRDGFMNAISNVQHKLSALNASMGPAIPYETFDSTSTSHGAPNPTTPGSTSTNSPSHGRWDELRTASIKQMGRNSSWDALRQSHERERIADATDASQSTENDRVHEQAQFDAMLEAERMAAINDSKVDP